MHSTLFDKTYVYGKNYEQSITPPVRRTAKDLFDSVFKLKTYESNPRGAEQYSMDSGVIGESKLWHLYHLYKFDLSRDLVFDVMHIAGMTHSF
jgi:hypothetical protein